ncbi:MAG: polysaccharide biosynthesis C-terminal domain-containing protein [Hyphomicrobiales bacterium]
MTTSAPAIGARRSLLRLPLARSRLRAGGLVLADQGLISASNFATTVIAARGLDPSAFGVFALAYVVLVSLIAVTFGLVTQPHNVLGAGSKPREYRRLTSTALILQLAATGVFAVAVGAAGVIPGLADGSVVASLVVALAAWQVQDFLRRILITEARYRAVLLSDVVSYGPQPFIFFWLWRSSELTPTTAIVAVAVTSAAGVIAGLGAAGGWLRYRIDRPVLGELLRLGRWFAGGQVLYVLSNHGYLALTAVLASTAATGSLRAALTIFGPLNVLFIAFDSVLPASYARALQRDDEAALALLVRETFLSTVGPVAAYCAAAALLAGPLLSMVFGAGDDGAGAALLLLAAQAFVSYLSRILLAAVRARGQSREVFGAYAWSVGLSLPLGAVLTFAWGATGAALAMLAGACVVLVHTHHEYRRPPAARYARSAA